jgi:hypothetical protein
MNTVSQPNTRRLRGLIALAAVVAGALALAQPANATAKTLNVNPISGADTNPATATAPLKTLTKALSTAVAGDTVKLAGGSYGQGLGGTGNGEQIPATGLKVPSGVTIDGATENGFPIATLLGQGSGVGLNLAGNATVRNLFVGGGAGFGIGIYAKNGTQTLSNLFITTRSPASATVDGVTFNGGHGILMRGTARTTLGAGASQANTTGSTILLAGNGGTGVSVNEQARFTMDGGSITSGDQPNCRDVTGIELHQSAQAALKNMVPRGLRNLAGSALAMTGSSKATVTRSLIQRALPAGCTPRPSVEMRDAASFTMQEGALGQNDGLRGAGIETRSSGPLTVGANVSLFGFATGISVRADGDLLVDRSSIGGNQVGIDAAFAEGSVTITNSTLAQGGLDVIGVIAPTLKMRNTEVSSNGTGIVITGPGADLGTLFDPGNNRILNNVTTSVKIDDAVRSSSVQAVGNTWEPNTQGADANGRYASPLLLVGGLDPFAQGRNFDVAQFNRSPNVGIRVAAIPVGAFTLSPRRLTARPGRTATWKLAWTHPVDWKRLDQIVLQLEHRGKPVGRVVVDQETRRLRASSSAVRLVPGRSGVSRGQVGGKRVTARLALRVARRYAGRTLVAKVAATDDDGTRQAFRKAGRVRVLAR